jgi:hypothetical protein
MMNQATSKPSPPFSAASIMASFGYQSVEWRKILEYISVRRQELFIQLVLADENAGRANILRGRIQELDEFLALQRRANVLNPPSVGGGIYE